MSTKPSPMALILCDSIYREETTGKTALVGMFTDIAASRLPIVHPRLAVFVSVTELHEGFRAKLDIINAESERPLASAAGPFPNETRPLVVADLSFVFTNLRFTEEGLYYVRFWANDHLLMCRPFRIMVVKSGSQE